LRRPTAAHITNGTTTTIYDARGRKVGGVIAR
jgi:hypothetical protein